MKTCVVCSGGLDSVTLAYKVAKERELSFLISFDYGQRHKKELEFAALCARDLGVPHRIVDISAVGAALTGSALTDDVNVPDGHYAQDTMKATVVPNRNAIMLAIAYGAANAQGVEAVATAVHGGDHFIYPDCRPDFIHAFATMQDYALDGMGRVDLYTPFLMKTKADIAAEAKALGVPVEKTWSCYKGGEHHCGRCGTCVERLEAFHLAGYVAGVDDKTVYDDTSFWEKAVADHKAAEQKQPEKKQAGQR